MSALRFIPVALAMAAACAVPTGARSETYRCADGTVLKARFPNPSLAVVSLGGRTVRLKSAMAASGAKYTGGGITFWEHQGEVSLERAGRSTTCR